MILETERPSNFDYINKQLKCWKFYDCNGPYLYIAIEVIGEDSACHVDMIRWSHNIAKNIKQDWLFLLSILKDSGVKRVVASYPKVDMKWAKFIELFGFPVPTAVMFSVMEI